MTCKYDLDSGAHFEVSSMRSAASVGDCMAREAAMSRWCAAAAAGVMGFAWPRFPTGTVTKLMSREASKVRTDHIVTLAWATYGHDAAQWAAR